MKVPQVPTRWYIYEVLNGHHCHKRNEQESRDDAIHVCTTKKMLRTTTPFTVSSLHTAAVTSVVTTTARFASSCASGSGGNNAFASFGEIETKAPPPSAEGKTRLESLRETLQEERKQVGLP